MTAQPALSAVVPTHDTRELTLRCLASLFAASPAPAEVILVDDGSVDGTADAVAASYPAVRLLRHEVARGFTAAANAGLGAAEGDVLLLLNSDTEVATDALGALLAALAADPRLAVAGAALHYPDGTPQWSGGPAPDLRWLLALASGLPARLGRLRAWRRVRPPAGHREQVVDWVTGAAMAIRRDAWRVAGPLDERFAFYAQDLDFCRRATQAGWRVAVVPAARVVHHHGATVASGAGVTAERHNPELLWTDLVRWVAKERGPAAARHAARALAAGGWLRRQLLRLEGSAGRGEAARAERRALRLAAAGAWGAANAAATQRVAR